MLNGSRATALPLAKTTAKHHIANRWRDRIPLCGQCKRRLLHGRPSLPDRAGRPLPLRTEPYAVHTGGLDLRAEARRLSSAGANRRRAGAPVAITGHG